jgi:uroporphyrinogen-III synthase
MRAREDAERTAARLAELGRASVIAPVTAIVATGAEAPPGPFDLAVATSAKAFDLLDEAFREAIGGIPLFVVGARTARAAAAKGLAIEEPAAPDVAALRARLGTRLRAPSRAIYLAGRDRKSELETALAAAGHRVAVIEIYEARERPAWTAGEAEEIARCGSALHYSARGAALASRLAGRAGIGEVFRSLRHVCISEDAAAALRAAGIERVVAARAADEDALFAALAVEPG